jgi:hypothetical protein
MLCFLTQVTSQCKGEKIRSSAQRPSSPDDIQAGAGSKGAVPEAQRMGRGRRWVGGQGIDDLVHGLPLCAKVHVGWIQNQLLHFQG